MSSDKGRRDHMGWDEGSRGSGPGPGGASGAQRLGGQLRARPARPGLGEALDWPPGAGPGHWPEEELDSFGLEGRSHRGDRGREGVS